MVELMVQEEKCFSIEETALFFGITETRLVNLLQKIEGSGYFFKRSDSGQLALTEEDIMMILCFT